MSARNLTLWGIRGLSLFGFLVFGLVFSLTYAAPERVERATHDFVVERIKGEIAGLKETSSNLAVFCGLLVASFLAGPRTRYLVAPAALLLASTLVSVTFYLFEQNWFYTILFESYLGFGYLGYVAFLFLWFCDIVYLKARVTRTVIDAPGALISKCGFPA